MKRRAPWMISVAVVAGMALAGCGSSSLDSGDHEKATVSSGVDAAAAALVPADIKSKGTLTVGSDASYAPNEYLAGDGTTVEGFDVDLFTAVAKVLGLKADFQNASFDTIISGVKGNKYDVGVSSFTINAERLEQVNMVSYFNAGTQWAAAAGNPKSVDTDKPCGLNIAVQKGTVQLDDITAKAEVCKREGKPVKVQVYDKQSAVTAAVVAGKADAMLADSPIVAYAVKQAAGKLASVGEIYDAAPYGYVVSKPHADLANAIVAALKKLSTSGDYTKILKNWGVDAGGVTDFAANPSVS